MNSSVLSGEGRQEARTPKVERLGAFYSNRRVLVTGHTGFKGSWLCEWLLELGADVAGIALDPHGDPALFEQLDLARRVEHNLLDVRDLDGIRAIISSYRPQTIFHLAAQSLVRESYVDPVATYATNVMGTVNLLDAIRVLNQRVEVVVVTSDKCYEPKVHKASHIEGDPLGGVDPYSASKGAAEIVAASYRRSFFPPDRFGTDHEVALATARAGNVIGGGDWATDRVVPDCARALSSGQPIPIRNPDAVRPWQHVLEPVGAYLALASSLAATRTAGEREQLFGAFNFGPVPESTRSVADLVEKILVHWSGEWVRVGEDDPYQEADYLSLNVEKAGNLLNWSPVWRFEESVRQTVEWYRGVIEDESAARSLTVAQLRDYMKAIG